MDGTEERKDSSQVEDTSSEQKETPKETPKTYTEASEKKAISDALSAAGRDAKSITDKATEAEKILTNAKTTRDGVKAEREQWQKDRDEAERESVKDDSQALKSLQERQRQRAKDTELARRALELDEREAKHKVGLEEADKVTKELRARDIASKHNIEAEALIKFTDGSKEAMEELATQLPKKGKAKTPLKTDAGTTIGGSLSDDALIKKSASGAFLTADEKTKAKQILGNLKGKIV